MALCIRQCISLTFFWTTLLVRIHRHGCLTSWPVDSCPGNLSEVEAATFRLNCSDVKDFRNVYHCLPLSNLSLLVEFCYDGLSGLVEKGNCMVLENQNLNNHPCNHFTNGCPNGPYFPKEMFKFPGCIHINKQNRCYLADSRCLHTISLAEATSTPTVNTMENKTVLVDATTMPTINAMENSIERTNVLIPVFLTLALESIVVFIGLVTYMWMRHRNRKRERKRNDDSLNESEENDLLRNKEDDLRNENNLIESEENYSLRMEESHPTNENQKSTSTHNWPMTWHRGKGIDLGEIDTSTEKYTEGTSRLPLIQMVPKEDQGDYQAIISENSNGQHIKIPSNVLSLKVTGERPVLQKLEVTVGKDGIRLHYKHDVAQTSPKVHHIAWTRNGEVLSIDQAKYVGGGITDNSLTITSPSVQDSGEYTCIIANAVGAVSESLTLGVPKATILAESVCYGNNTHIDSVISSCPPAERAVWEKSHDSVIFELINVGERKCSNSTLDPSNPVLKLTTATFDDNLYYRLHIWNSIGECFSNTVFLNVTGDPPNISNGHETNINSRSVKLTCDVFLYDRSPPLTEMEWQRDEIVIDVTRSGGKYTGGTIDDPSLVIHNVNESDAGSYLCKASNAVGSTFGNVILLDVPGIEIQGPNVTGNGRYSFTALLKSIPTSIQAQWSMKNETNDDYLPIDINSEEYKGTSNSLPQPLLCLKQKPLQNHHFKIEVQNFIGTNAKMLPVDRLTVIFSKKGSSIRFNNLRLDLIREISEKELKTLKSTLTVMTSMELLSIGNISTVEDFFTFLIEEGIFKDRNVILMQYLMRSIKRFELERKCVEYAIKNKQALCYFEETNIPGDGSKHIKVHVVDDIEKFTDMDSLLATVAAIAGCDQSCVTLVGVHPDSSFIIVIEMKEEFAQILGQKDRHKLTGLLKYNVDWIEIEKERIPIPQAHNLEAVSLDIEYESSYGSQLQNFLSSHCKNLFRKILQKYVLEEDFISRIQKSKIQMLPFLTVDQQNALFPERGSFSGSYKHLDMPLMYILFQQICFIKPHKQGWGNSPDESDTSLAACIEKIMEIQREYCSGAHPSLTQSDFDRIIKRILQLSGNIEEALESPRKDTDGKEKVIEYKENMESGFEKEENVLEKLRDMSISQCLSPTVVSTSSITIPGIHSVYHISCVTADRLWVSGDRHLLQIDSCGHEILKKRIETDMYPFGGLHTVSEYGELFFIDQRHNKVQKMTSDGTITTFIQAEWIKICCIHSSRINGDILVGYIHGMMRYDRTGQRIGEFMEDWRHGMYYPRYITENRNGDIWVSDEEEVVVVDKSGRHRFNYRGQKSQSYFDYGFEPRGICTDILGQVLVCDFYHFSVHLLDQDGQFLCLLLTEEQGLHRPMALCVDDKHNLYLGQEGSNTITVYNYLQETEKNTPLMESK